MASKTPVQKLARLIQQVYGMRYCQALATAQEIDPKDVRAEIERLRQIKSQLTPSR